MKIFCVVLFCAITSNAQAQELADKISYITVAANIGLDTIHSFKADDKKEAFIKQGIRTGIVIGVSELLKRTVSKQRPDHSDDLSFPSEHSGLSCVSIGIKENRRLLFEVPIAVSTITGRIKARKHDIVDTLSGCGIGILTSLVTDHVRHSN